MRVAAHGVPANRPGKLARAGCDFQTLLTARLCCAPLVPIDFKLKLRAGFDGSFILFEGIDLASAGQALRDRHSELIAFGRPVMVDPDLVARMRKDAPFNASDMATFYLPGAQGQTDYSALVACLGDST